MMKKFFVFLSAMALTFGVAGISNATLLVRGMGTIESGGSGDYQLIYDDVLDITWLDYSRYDDLRDHLDWTSILEISFDGQMFGGWRLPETLPVNGSAYDYNWSQDGSTDEGYNISALGSAYPETKASEMAHLYYTTLGNLSDRDVNGNPLPGWCLHNTGPFENLHHYVYWSSTEYSPITSGNWVFDFQWGLQRSGGLGSGYAIAVLPGDVAPIPEPVPEPSTIFLISTGLIGLAGFKKKLKK